MIWTSIWSRLFGRTRPAPARRASSQAKLAVESLEDRVVPSLTYAQWQQQAFRVDDMIVANLAQAVPTNASFGSMIGLPSVFTNTPYRGGGYSVAVIDTGIDYRNPALGGGFGAGRRVVAGWDFVNNDADPMDDNGHGTHVAGIIGSSDATYSGIAPNVNLIALKVLSATGSGTFGNVENALKWVAANRAKYNIVAVNLSLGTGNYTTNPYTFLSDEFSTLKSGGVFLSVAAGNSFYSYNSAPGLDYPAIDSQVVSVGAVWGGNFGAVAWASGARDNSTAVDRVASFSQRSSALTIMAPGALITSTYLNNSFKSMAGTSMAAPVIAGASVLIHQAMDTLKLTANQDTIVGLMKNTGVKVIDGDDENDNVTNTGLTFKRIHLGAALASLGAPTTPTPGNSAPVLQAISNQIVAPGQSISVALNATDADGDPLTFSARVLSSTAAQAYQLKQQLGLLYSGSYYYNAHGYAEKWIASSSGTWYFILPSGDLYRWTGVKPLTIQAGNLIAWLGTGFYADPRLLWNAQPSSVPNVKLSIAGNQLTVQAPAGAAGSYQIQVSASDGSLASVRTFTVTVQSGNTAPQLGALASQSLLANRSQTITLNATDAQNNPITFSARILGTFASAPASLAVAGNQLTIHTSPTYVGSFDVQVTASDGALSSSAVMRVTVSASPVANRFSADFNGDGIKDTASYNTDGSWWISTYKADGSFVNQQWAKWSGPSNWGLIQVGDVNGDGKADLLGGYKDGTWWVSKSTGAGFTGQSLWATWEPSSNWTSLQAGDFNGDGRLDILGLSARGSVYVALSTGTTFNRAFWAQWAPAEYWSSFSTADVNDDGKLDFIGLATSGKYYVAYSSGSSFNTQIWTATTPPK